ncbi:hypothetical protein GUITHDRAFT_139057 [Guillardia theta CCMP2712]|uniref:SAP domain-containing protein n=1 Tax=Guillardia theta (strain CCMP2712) TaxID=905079 RepID=L1JAD0_GUITC|nr:hypothetical protein GUITHDRAFT_139057 [Guillardia theta CCMP2712]EKX45503.1 hypothetical protein GUITHDRAFT_139057 [Guillardia theta CCMP2712]|eukprot:XP_005832483.1 hypothetical protein GUITHDRAFT_139057 [Guillardia theta CCMP2712]
MSTIPFLLLVLGFLGLSESFNLPWARTSLPLRTTACRRPPQAVLLKCMSSDMTELNKLTVAQLKEKLVTLGEQPTSRMKKAELIERISSIAGEGASSTLSSSEEDGERQEGGGETAGMSSGGTMDLSSMTVTKLKNELKSRGLKTSGVKAELQERLAKAMEEEEEGAELKIPDPHLAAVLAESDEDQSWGAQAYGEEGETEVKSSGVEEDSGEQEESEEEDDAKFAELDTDQIFVRGISFKARPLDLVDFFESQCGTVTKIEGMFMGGKASGRAWVTFEDKLSASEALKLGNQTILDRTIEIYPPWSRPARQAMRMVTEGQGIKPERRPSGMRERQNPRFSSPRNSKVNSIFIGKIPLGADKRDIEEAIADFRGSLGCGWE